MDKIEIIERISKARHNANLSARALSQRIEMNDGYINRLESKKDFLPSLEVLLKIVEACGLTIEQFFYSDMNQYVKDKEIIELLSKVNDDKKFAILTLLRN